MAKRIKRPVEKWGGRKLQATVNGKDVCVKKDPHTLTYFMNPPKENSRGRERRWLSRDLGRAANDFTEQPGPGSLGPDVGRPVWQ